MVLRRSFLNLGGLASLGLLAFSSAAVGQEKSAKELIVGTWTLSIADHVRADGSKAPGFGPLPSGTVTFGADGRYSVQVMPSQQPMLVSADRANATVGAGQTPLQTTVTHSGTYTVDEAQKTLTLRIEQASLPNWGGTTQAGTIKFVVGDDLGWTSPKALSSSSDFAATELIWRRAR
jgi:hypothetical protein